MVGIFIHSNDNYRSGVELRANGTCDIASSLDSKFNVYFLDCTYIRKDKEVILTYYRNASNKYVTISHEAIEREECPLYYTPIFDDYCLFKTEIDAPYSDVRGYLKGTKCIEEYKKPFEIHQYCVDGFKISNGRCEKEDSYDAGYKITCPNGFSYVNDNTCEKIIIKDIMFEYICPNEYTLKNNSVCSKIISKEPYYK